MILSAKKVLELNGKHRLIENLSERELSNPEGVGIDLRLGEVYKLEGDGYLGVEERKTPEAKKVADIKDGSKSVTINPGELFLATTMERINLPAEKIVIEEGEQPRHLIAVIHPRNTLQRCGIYLRATKTDPGFHGELTFALANLGKSPFKIDLGARFVNVVFEQVIGDIQRAYDGQWQGGRRSGHKTEKQN